MRQITSFLYGCKFFCKHAIVFTIIVITIGCAHQYNQKTFYQERKAVIVMNAEASFHGIFGKSRLPVSLRLIKLDGEVTTKPVYYDTGYTGAIVMLDPGIYYIDNIEIRGFDFDYRLLDPGLIVDSEENNNKTSGTKLLLTNAKYYISYGGFKVSALGVYSLEIELLETKTAEKAKFLFFKIPKTAIAIRSYSKLEENRAYLYKHGHKDLATNLKDIEFYGRGSFIVKKGEQLTLHHAQ